MVNKNFKNNIEHKSPEDGKKTRNKQSGDQTKQPSKSQGNINEDSNNQKADGSGIEQTAEDKRKLEQQKIVDYFDVK